MFQERRFHSLEMVFAIGLFLLVVMTVTGVFTKSSQIQRKIIELHTIQREGNYMIEMMSREIRMAAAIDEATQSSNSDHDIEFDNYNTDLTKYCRSDSGGACLPSGEYLSRNNEVVSSSNIRIADLKFYSNDFSAANEEQPLITISMKIKPAITQHNTEISLQSSVALRVY